MIYTIPLLKVLMSSWVYHNGLGALKILLLYGAYITVK